MSMKIIDENGRLFGKINVIDLLVIIFFLFLTPTFYFGYRIFHKKPVAPVTENVEAQKKEFIEIELSFIFKRIDPNVLSLISPGDKEIGKDKEIMGEILSLGEIKPYSYEIAIGSAKKVISDAILKDLPVILRIRAEFRQNNLYYKDRQIVDNASIDFMTDKYRLEAFYMPNLIKNNNRVENVSDSIKIIQQKQKEMEYVVSKLQNKVDFLENKIGSVEDRMASMAETVVSEGTKKSEKKK